MGLGASTCWFPKEADAISAFYPDCPPELAAWAASKLRPQSTTPHRVIDEPFDWPELPCASIVCAEDRVAREPNGAGGPPASGSPARRS